MKIKLSGFLQWRINIFIYLSLGWGFTKIYMYVLCKIYFLVKQKEKEIIRKAVKDAIGKGKGELDIKKIINKVFKGIYCHYYEKIFMAFEEKSEATEFLNRHVRTEDLVVLRNCLNKGKGAIVITGHYGAIEFIPTLLSINNFDVAMVAKFTTRQLRRKVYSQAKKYKIKIIDAGEAGNVLRKAISELKKNKALITQCDEIEEWRPSKKRETIFLGQVTGLDRTINLILKRTDAELVFGVVHRYSLNDYRLVMYSFEDMIRMLGLTESLSKGETVLKVLEQFIYHYPEQWYQWKKYPEFGSISSPGIRDYKQTKIHFLEPMLVKVM